MIKSLPATYLILFLSCNSPSERAPVEIKNGDVPIAYHLTGHGDTSVVLVHGWAINKEYWKHQQDALSSQYTVVSLDLGGHGQSGNNRNNWTVEEYAKDVIAVINGLQLKNVVLVGHSMGGEIILQTALTIPDKVIGFIGVDNFKYLVTAFTPQEEREINEFLQGLKTNFDTTAIMYTKLALFPRGYADSTSINRVVRSIREADSVAAIKSLESIMHFALKDSEMISRLPIPIHLIVSDYTVTNEELIRRASKAGYSIRTIKGVGHYPMIEKPEQFTQLLLETIQQIGRKQ